MADSEQNRDSNTLPPAPMADKAIWVNMFSQLENTLTETTNLLSEFRADSSDLGLEKRRQISEKYKTPENCAQLFVLKVNQPIWSSLRNFHRQHDLCIAVLQDSVVRVFSALSVTIDELLQYRENKGLPDYGSIATRISLNCASGPCSHRIVL